MRYLLVLGLGLMSACLPKPAEPTLLEVKPRVVDASRGGAVTLVGSGFLPAATLDFDHPDRSAVQAATVSAFVVAGDARVDLVDVSWVDATQVIARVANPAPLGVYDVHLIEPRGRELVLPQALAIVDCSEVDCPTTDGGVEPDSGVVGCMTQSYRDRDLDGFGSGMASNVCGPGWVTVSGDCDDRDPLTNPLATEVCNGFDDDCDGQIDEGRCSDAGWTAVTDLLSPSNDLKSVSSFSAGAWWAVGGPNVFVRRGELGITDNSAGCPSSLAAVWAEPTGEAEVAGVAVASQLVGGSACTNTRGLRTEVVAMTGFPEVNDAQYVGVSANGQLYWWKRGTAPDAGAPTNLTSRDTVFDLHGSSPTELYAVGMTQLGAGGGAGNRRPAAWALQSDGGWRAEALDFDNNGIALRGVWVLSPTDIVAVGDQGTVLRKSGATWSRLDANTNVNLTAVRAFSNGRFYVTQADGRILRRARGVWTVVYRNDGGVRFNDLAGTSEEDLWAVGDDGVIGRGPH